MLATTDMLGELCRAGKSSLCPSSVQRVTIGAATCGQAAGSNALLSQLVARADLAERASIVSVGCIGACFAEPLIDVRTPRGMHYFFGAVDTTALWHVIRCAHGREPSRYLWAIAREQKTGSLRTLDDLQVVQVFHSGFAEFFRIQKRRICGRCGLVDPSSLAEYVATGGYSALAHAVLELQPDDVIQAVATAGLRGRGGAGFPTAQKWSIAARSPDCERIVIANADEGDPGAYMNRALLESDPHSVLEGLILTAYAIGARRAYVFVRHEYPLAMIALRGAISSARLAGLLGPHIMGSRFSLEVTVVESAGAFVAGEETSMLQVMAGRRGEPKPRPPYPVTQGLGGHPTVINNVETLANVPWILSHSAHEFRELGTSKSPGTKVFCLTGDVKRPGFIEVPLGTDTMTLVESIGGTRLPSVKALQIGGPSGSILPPRAMALDYEAAAASNTMMGSGGLVLFGHDRCLVALCQHLTDFMANESCGKCVMCRDGLKVLVDRLQDIVSGHGDQSSLDRIEDLAQSIRAMAQCGLGKGAVSPVLSTLKHFRSEYQAHLDGHCPALTCSQFITFEIDRNACSNCHCCYLLCPVDAVKPGSDSSRHLIDKHLCVNCWACFERCPNGCITPVDRGSR